MNQSVHKILSIMLIFLLGLSPLQSVIADISVPAEQASSPCHSASDAVDMVEAIQQESSDCEMCATASDCNNLCNQCVSNSLALLQYSPPLSITTSSLVIIQTDKAPTIQQLPALFRPPRV